MPDLTLALENLHWVLHSRKDKTVGLEDAIDAFSKYIMSDQRAQVYRGIRDFIADGVRRLLCVLHSGFDMLIPFTQAHGRIFPGDRSPEDQCPRRG